jgi:hypothetical protein
VSVPLLMQPEDGGHQAAASLAPRRPRASRDPRRPRPPRPHRARQTRSSSVTAVTRPAGYPDPRPRLQWPGRSLISVVCLVLVIVRVLFCVIVRPFVFVRVFVRPRACSPSCVSRCTVPARPCLARSLHRVPQQQPLGPPYRHYWRPTESQKDPPSEHARRGQVPPGSITAMLPLV